jgi:4-carboxymuconolactone decarboxylase
MVRIAKKKTAKNKNSFPPVYQRFIKDYEEVAEAYHALGQTVHNWGPLDEKTRIFVKLGIAVGSRSEGAVHSHVRKALAAKVTPEEIRHAILLSLSTIGFPTMIAALTWAEDILSRKP